MFTQPINQSGLSGFIPVRRQEGGVSNQELDIGQIAEFDIFGRAIPKTTTDIGQIENPQQLAPGLPQGISSLIPVDGGADDSFEGAPDFTPPDVSLDTVTEGVSNLGETISGIPDTISESFEGKDGSFSTSKVAAGIAGGFAKTATTTALSNMGRAGVIASGPLGSLLSSMVAQKVEDFDKPFDVPELAFQTGLGFLAAAVPVLALPIALFNLIRSFWGEDEGEDAPGEDAPGSGIDAATSGLGIGIAGMPGITGPGFDDFSGFDEPSGPEPSESTGGGHSFGGGGAFGGDDTGPEGGDSPGEGADGDADGPGPGDPD